MYIMNASIEAIDDQNEVITIGSSNTCCADIKEESGTIILYSNVTYEEKSVGGSRKIFYTIQKVPCTIYRNLKKITIKSGSRILWKYIRFAK